MADWTTISSLATAGGTLVLSTATFASVRSANRAARVSERALQARLRPVLVPSRPGDPDEKIVWVDQHHTRVGGGHASVELVDDVLYLAIPLRNVGNGLAVLHGWFSSPEWPDTHEHASPDAFRPMVRDLYIAAGDTGYWHSAIRDPTDLLFADLAGRIDQREAFMVDLLYGDHEGGQRVISRFGIVPASDSVWLASIARHWNVDRDDPR